jgi:hypothetical protein
VSPTPIDVITVASLLGYISDNKVRIWSSQPPLPPPSGRNGGALFINSGSVRFLGENPGDGLRNNSAGQVGLHTYSTLMVRPLQDCRAIYNRGSLLWALNKWAEVMA